jgi:glycosyltransferase involved in cell wall biosynthesis
MKTADTIENGLVVNSGNSSNLRVLCISPYFPPILGAESLCGGKLVKALLDAGVDISVLHCSNFIKLTEDRSSFGESFDGAAIDVLIPPESKQRMKSLLLAARYQTYLYVRWIDAMVQRASQLHAQRKFDLVYSRSNPVIAHQAGFWCAKKLNLPWVVNMNDPWDTFMVPGRASHETSPLYRAMSTHWLKKTLNHADLVMYPTERLRQYQGKFLNIDRACAILPHIGYTASASNHLAELASPATFHLVHTGSLGSHEKPNRSADSLLIGLSEFLKANPGARSITKLSLVGPDDPETTQQVSRLGLQSSVRTIGQVSYEESLRYIASATACILVEAQLDEGIFLPSKLVDYLVARKPVLAVSPRIGVVADLAAHGGILRVDTNDHAAMRDVIADLYTHFTQGTLDLRAPSDDQVEGFKADAIARKFIAAVEPVTLRRASTRSTSRSTHLHERTQEPT